MHLQGDATPGEGRSVFGSRLKRTSRNNLAMEATASQHFAFDCMVVATGASLGSATNAKLKVTTRGKAVYSGSKILFKPLSIHPDH